MTLSEGSLALQLNILESGVCMCVGVVSIKQKSKSVYLSQESLLQKGPQGAGRPVLTISHTMRT